MLIHPYFVIVHLGQLTQEADRVCQVMHMSEATIVGADRLRYKMDDDFIESIKGEGKPDNKYRESQYKPKG